MYIHNFYVDLLKSVPYIFYSFLGKDYFKSVQYDLESRTETFEKNPINVEAPALYVRLESPNSVVPWSHHLFRSPTVLDRWVLYDVTKDITVYLQERFIHIPVTFSILLETATQAKELEFHILNNLPPNLYLRPYSFTAFLELPSELFCYGEQDDERRISYALGSVSQLRSDFSEGVISVPPGFEQPSLYNADEGVIHENLRAKPPVRIDLLNDDVQNLYIHPCDDKVVYKCAVYYEPLVQLTSVSATISKSVSQFFVNGSLYIGIPFPWQYFVEPMSYIENIVVDLFNVDSVIVPSVHMLGDDVIRTYMLTDYTDEYRINGREYWKWVLPNCPQFKCVELLVDEQVYKVNNELDDSYDIIVTQDGTLFVAKDLKLKLPYFVILKKD